MERNNPKIQNQVQQTNQFFLKMEHNTKQRRSFGLKDGLLK